MLDTDPARVLLVDDQVANVVPTAVVRAPQGDVLVMAARRLLAAGVRDAQRELGRGRRRTWPDRALPFVPPFVDLDHVLIRGLDVAAFDTFAVPGTDHYAVSAALVPGDG